MSIQMHEGVPSPRGATWDGKGTNFAVFSEHATKVEVCFFDESGQKEIDRQGATGIYQPNLAWIHAKHSPGYAIRLPRLWAV